MRTRYWVFAKGTQAPYFVPDEIYFLHPRDLEDWIAGYERRLATDLRVVDAAHKALTRAGGTPDQLDRLRVIGNRDITINNPKISWSYVKEHGTLLGSTPSVDLRALVAARPLRADGPS